MNLIRILNIDVLSIGKVELLQELKEGVVYTPNIDHLVKLQSSRSFYNAYKEADWVICDSRILYLFSKLLPFSIKEAIPGSSFFPAYYYHHRDNPDVRIFLLGAGEGVAVKAMHNVNEKVHKRLVVGAHSPSFGFEKNEQECQLIVDMINKSSATVLVVGVGAPKQEIWIHKHKGQLPKIHTFMALGATIDFEANNIVRAPRFFQQSGLEWLFRLLKEPRRLWKRYLIEDLSFFLYFWKQLRGKYVDPFRDSFVG